MAIDPQVRARAVQSDPNLRDLIPEIESEIAAATAGATELTADELAAVQGAAAPSALNVFATMADLPADELTADELAAVQGAPTPATGANPFVTVGDVIPKARDLYFTVTVGAEAAGGAAAETCRVTVAEFDSDGVADPNVYAYAFSLYSADGVELLTAAYTCTVVAGCAADSTNGRARLFLSSLGGGTFTVDILDVGPLNTPVWLVVDRFSENGGKAQSVRKSVPFAV